MFGISGEHILVLGIVLLLFGPRRLPELGNTMGKAIRNFKDALAGVEEASFRKIGEPTAPSHQLAETQKSPQQTPVVVPTGTVAPGAMTADASSPTTQA